MQQPGSQELSREVSETILLFFIAIVTLAGYVGIALAFIGAAR